MRRFSILLAVVFMLFVGLNIASAEKTSITIKGMMCDGCVNKVTTALKNVDGVSTANVNLEKGLAVVEFDAQKTSLDKLETAIAAVGYDAGNVKAQNPHKCKDKHEAKNAAGEKCCKSKAKKSCCGKK